MSELALRVQVWVAATFASLKDDERGQDLIEYALWGGLIAAALVTLAVTVINTGITDMAQGLANCIDFDGTADCGPFA